MSNKTEKITFRVTPDEKHFLVDKANKCNMKLSEYVLSSSLKSTITIIDRNADIARYLCNITTEINLLKLTYVNVDFKNLDKECDNAWLTLNV